MGIYLIILLLFIYLSFVFVEITFQNFLIEFGINKTQPITLDMVKEVIALIVEKKLCSKLKKPLPLIPMSNDLYSIKAVYFILSCIFCAFLGYISGTRKRNKNMYSIEQNICNQNGSDNESTVCSFCLNVFKPGIVLLPCKHICICTHCYVEYYQESHKNCPICRENIVDIMEVYST